MFAAMLAVVLTMPPNWQHVKTDASPGAAVEMLDIATGPHADGFTQNINVLRHQLTAVPDSISAWADASVAYLASKPDTKVLSSHAERECNGTIDGWLIESTGRYNGRGLDLVQTALLDGGYEYVATYARLVGTPANDDAMKALDTLCPTALSSERRRVAPKSKGRRSVAMGEIIEVSGISPMHAAPANVTGNGQRRKRECRAFVCAAREEHRDA